MLKKYAFTCLIRVVFSSVISKNQKSNQQKIMKKMYILSLLLVVFSNTIYSQTNQNSETPKSYALGNHLNYFNTVSFAKNFNNEVNINVNENESYTVNLYTYTKNEVIGKLEKEGSVFSLHTDEKGTKGYLIVSADDNIVYKFTTDFNGVLSVAPADINSVRCHDYHTGVNKLPKRDSADKFVKEEAVKSASNVSALELESLPGSENVILVDMDGYVLPSGTEWNNGSSYQAAALGWSEEKEKLIWAEIAEDFAPFDVNVTTKEALWDAAEKTNRQKLIITSSRTFSGGNGVASLNSFGDNRDSVCWMWVTNGFTTDEVGDVGSHEVGHTLGLEHQAGPSGPYFPGNDDPSHDGWVPLMGNAYKKIISQWCNSEFDGATANQDDIAIMVRTIPYNADDHSDTASGATNIVTNTTTGDVAANENEGLITTRTDVDYFKFASGVGTLNLTIKPRPLNGTGVILRTNLDVIVKLYDSKETLIATAEAGHKDLLDGAVFNHEITQEGVYYIEVDGYGTGNPSTGYTDYGSLGPYSVSGNIPPSQLSTNDVEANSVRIYPIPTDGAIVIEGLTAAKEYILVNNIGQVVKKGNLMGISKEEVDLRGLQNGYYVMKIKTEKNFITKPVIINQSH